MSEIWTVHKPDKVSMSKYPTNLDFGHLLYIQSNAHNLLQCKNQLSQKGFNNMKQFPINFSLTICLWLSKNYLIHICCLNEYNLL